MPAVITVPEATNRSKQTSFLIMMLGLPILVETVDNLICYRNALPTTGCTPDLIEAATGPIIDYATVAQPTADRYQGSSERRWRELGKSHGLTR